jgi:hypothetical protein
VRSLRFVALIAAVTLLLPSAVLAASTAAAPQGVTGGELQRYIYQAQFPSWCGDAGMVAREFRVKPSTDPKTLHNVMKTYIACANGSYAQNHPALWNTAIFGAAAAALLAARHEGSQTALRDATYAANWSQDIVNFTHQPGAGNPGPGSNTPSMYRTNADRMHKDATALIAAFSKAHTSPAPLDTALPAHAAAPGAPAHATAAPSTSP